jgi:hypothetical protein
MLKAFEGLEKAVNKFLEREERQKSAPTASRGASAGAAGSPTGLSTSEANEEATDLIRRAIKRLKAL